MERKQKNSNRGKALSADARRIVYKVLKYFEKEKKEDRLIHPIQHASFRSQFATGLTRKTMCRIKKEGDLAAKQGIQIQALSHGNRGRHRKVPVDNIMLTAIREIISFTDRKNVPSLPKLTDIAKKQLNFKGSYSTMRRLLKDKLGFRYKKCSKNRNLLLERSNIIAWRVKYLRRIRLNDALGAAKRPVVFVGETCIDFHNTESEGEETATDHGAKKKKTPAQRWVIAHAGSEQGFLPDACLLFKANNNYCDAMTVEDFTKFAEGVIPNLPPNSIVVMDNSPYHSKEINDTPTTVTSKCTIQEWLYERNIHYDEDWTKAELLQVVRRNKPEKTCLIDNMFAAHGHEVLRLPPYNCDLNPIEYIWNLMKKKVAVKNVDRSQTEIRGLLKHAIKSIKPSDWAKQVNNVKRLEKQYWTADVIKEHELEDVIMEMGVVDYDSDDEHHGDDHKSDDDVDESSESDVEELHDEEGMEELQDEDNRSCTPPGTDTGGKTRVPKPRGRHHEGYRCHECRGDIVGFRYCCVQCRNWDLCGACEARERHAQHCVLRVPSDKEHMEVCAIVQRIHNLIKEHQRSYAQIRLREPNVQIEVDQDEDSLQEDSSAQQLVPCASNQPVLPAQTNKPKNQSYKPEVQSYKPEVKPWPTLQLTGTSGKRPVITVHTDKSPDQTAQTRSTLHRPGLAVKSYRPEGKPGESHNTEEQSDRPEETSISLENSQSELEEPPTGEELQPTRKKRKKYIMEVSVEDESHIE